MPRALRGVSFMRKSKLLVKGASKLAAAAILPNSLFWLTATHLEVGRPWFNLDYLLCSVIIAAGWSRTGLIVAAPLVALDAITILGQIIPFPRLEDLFYVAKFSLLTSETHILLLLISLLACFITWSALVTTSRQAPLPILWLTLLVATASPIITPPSKERFYKTNSTLAASQTQKLIGTRKDVFVTLSNGEQSELIDLSPKASATSQALGNKRPQRILLIIAESWGVPKNPAIQKQLLHPILLAPVFVRSQGYVRASGMTLAGELRELCGARPTTYNLKNLTQGFEKCLPNQLSNAGYITLSLHGAGGAMYDRMHWYPRAGFQSSSFFEHRATLNRCYSFPGSCDLDLLADVSTFFAKPGKRFLYWLTLNSHAPYDARDIRKNSFNCSDFRVPNDSESCRNLKLQAQFFDGLAKLISDKKLRDVEVIIVGDHAPVLLQQGEKNRIFEPNKVPWLSIHTR